MIRLSGLVWLFFISLITFGLFHVKHSVQKLDRETLTNSKKIDALENAVGVFKAEWSYLNQPQRLEKLAVKNFGQGYSDINNKGSELYNGTPLRKPNFGGAMPASYQPGRNPNSMLGGGSQGGSAFYVKHQNIYNQGIRSVGTPDIIGDLVDVINRPTP